ncbi:Putative Glycosyltransferase(Glycosyl transferase, family 1,201-364) [Magnetospirillum sp. XM-1]|uniref:glycosyltransferase family 4 protein n=1 Tax=Magnetospirillum sp. XM-1 TaxID=1663591 RepID=UPI00073DE137|nr:glycosyltransferase family 4 protein [Magnetospirillum sp. XM-1]CUW38335.1 Putative Glycosyltransferase(Glycosyl transferase, family 1,201-364) [Magnetospirillum sp. XM-1]
MDHVAPIEAPSPAVRQPVVLQVLPALVTGGVERGTVDMAVALAEAGWTAIVASEGGPMVRELTRAGAIHITLPLASKNPLTIRSNALKLADLIATHQVDIVHARSRAPAWSAWIAAQATGAHYVTTFHGTYNLGWFGLKQKYNAVMTRGERVIAISDFIAEHARRIYGLEADRVRVVHRGIDMTRFDPARVSPERIIQLAQKWRLPDGYQVIMLPGRLTRWKGQAVLIEALALLGRHDVRCLLVGSDQGRTGYREELVELIKRRDLTDVVHLADECSDMPAAYMLTDVVVSASTDPEAFGRIAVEGQAMGRPVIATAHGATDETVLPGRTGWLTAPGDAAALAQALDRFLALSAEERDLMAKDAMDFVRSKFSKESMCASTLDVYREVLGMDPVPIASGES